MSKQQNAQGRQEGASTNPQVGSRLARTNPNGQQGSRLAYNSNIASDIFAISGKKEVEQPTSRVLTNDRNVGLQEADKKKTSNYPSTNNSTINQPSTASSSDQSTKAMGLISNAFLGATNKFMKGNIPSTPVKIIEQVVEQAQDTPKVTPPSKFSRNKEQVEPKSRTISMKIDVKEVEAPSTDRSQLEGAKKIERRPAAGTRELRFTEKKEEKIESTPEKILTVVTPASKKVEVEVKTEVKTEVKEEESYPRLYQQPAQKPERIARSRLVSEAPKQEPEPVKEVSVESKPKEIVRQTPTNRLVASRSQQQQQLVQSKIEESKPSQSKVSEKQPISKPTPNRSNIKLTAVLMTEPQIVTTPPQQQIKPKPYSRSFITRKNQTNTEMANSAVNNQASTVTKPTNTVTALSQSNITKTQQPVRSQQKSKVEQKEVEEKQQAIVLKKSACATLIIKRLLTQTLANVFIVLKANKQADKAKKVNECSILTYSITTIAKLKQGNLIKHAFQNIKKKFTATYITSLKSYAETPTVNYKNTAIALLDRVFSSKVRNMFRVLKESSERAKNRVKCVTTLQSFVRKKLNTRLRDSLSAIQLRQRNQTHIINQLTVILTNYNKSKLALAFSKIYSSKPANTLTPQPASLKSTPQRGKPTSRVEQSPSIINTSNPALIDKLEKLKTNTSSVNTEITTLQSNLQRKKKGTQTQKSNLQQRITVLKHQNQQINNQVQIKKHRSDQIKKEMQTTLPKNQSLEQELTYSRQSKLEFLTNLYVSSYKNPEQPITVDDIINNYNLRPLDSSSLLFHQWQSIHLNVQLKRTIAAYEGADPKHNKGRTNLLSEQGLISKLIRSYVKEQYFWHWIHLSAQNI